MMVTSEEFSIMYSGVWDRDGSFLGIVFHTLFKCFLGVTSGRN